MNFCLRRNFALSGLLMMATRAPLLSQAPPDIAQQIAAIMEQGPSGKAHERFIHAKGIVCTGNFQPSPGAAAISRAAHLTGGSVPVTVRFSDGAPDTTIPDTSPDASPRGMAIRFDIGRGTDVMAISHNGFLVGTGEEFLEFQQAIAATNSATPHPSPVEAFLGSHPKAFKFVQEVSRVPASFATESFYSNNALLFVNNKQEKQAGRYQIVPVSGSQYLNEAEAKDRSSNFLSDELRERVAKNPVKFRLLLQLAGPGDRTNDGSVVWPDDRRKVELGMITINSVVPDSTAAEHHLAFDPTHLLDGIELSDDPLPALRSRVYVFSVLGRRRREDIRGTASAPYPDMPGIAPIGVRIGKYDEVPDSAKGPAIDAAKGYRIQQLGKGLYMITDNAYQSMFMTYEKGVVVIDAPPSYAGLIRRAIAEVTDKPITHLIYSHSHVDHIAGAKVLGATPIIIAQEETKRYLVRANDPNRPIPTVTFRDRYTLRVGSQTLVLSYHGNAHEPGNIFIQAPSQKVLMVVDIICPGWMPWRRLSLATDIPGYFAQVEEIRNMSFDTLVSGHVTRTGTKADVELQSNFLNDLKNAAAQALGSTKLGEGMDIRDQANPWALFDNYTDRVMVQCVNTLTPKWSAKLAAFDVLIWDQCYAMEQSLRGD